MQYVVSSHKTCKIYWVTFYFFYLLFKNWVFYLFIYLFIYLFVFLGPHPRHVSSQARGRVGAAAAGLHHSHSHVGSELLLWFTPQFARDWTGVLRDTSQVHYHWATTGTPLSHIFLLFDFSILFFYFLFLPESHFILLSFLGRTHCIWRFPG